MSSSYIYSYGMVSSSTLYTIAGQCPEAEGYGEIDRITFMTGGEATNSSIVLARLGNRVKLDGNWLGDDASGRRTRALLDENGIDASRLEAKNDYQGVQEVVFAAGATRTIFGTYGSLLANAEWNSPVEEDIVGASAVCLDPFFAEASRRAARIAAHAGIPAITVDCRHDEPLLRDTTAIVVSESFLGATYPGEPHGELFEAYRETTDGLVIFTFGANSIWYGRPGKRAKRGRPSRWTLSTRPGPAIPSAPA